MADQEHAATAVTTETFDQEVKQFPGVVLIDFWAAWCAPCRAMAPRIAEMAEKYKENPQVKVVSIDIDAENDLTTPYNILSIPTFKTFVKGEPDDQRIGLIPASELEKMIESGLSKVTA